MAESISHRLKEYLRNGQTSEEINAVDYTPQLDSNNEGGLKRNWEGQRPQNHDRRSSLTSFADLYERAVRNVLNIRPLFDTPLDIFEQRRPGGHNQPLHPQQQQHHTGRKTRPENGLQQEPVVKDDPERKSSEARIPRPEYPHGGHNESASRFFTHVLSEQIRHSHPRSYASPSQMPRYTGDERKIHTQSNLPTSSQTTQNRNNAFYDRAHDGYRRYWSQQTGHNYKHKPGMLDSMKHPPRHQIEFQTHENTSDVKEPIKQEIRTEKEDQSEAEIKSDSNELSKNIDYKPLTDAELENYKDKVRENARLKYRPYSLRSKKNGMRKKFTSGKRKGNKNKKANENKEPMEASKQSRNVFI